MISEQFIWFGAAVNLLAAIGYVMATVRGQARPNRVSWGLWSITSWLAFAGQLDEGVGMVVVLTATVALIPSLIFLASFIGGAYWEFSKLDIVCIVLWTIALVAWQLTAIGIVAILLSITVDAVAGIPTVVKAWREPESESHVAYTAGMFSAGCTLLTLTEFSIASAAFAIYFFALCATISFLLLVTPRLRLRALRNALRFPMDAPLPERSRSAQLRDPFAPRFDRPARAGDPVRYRPTEIPPLPEPVRTYRGIPYVDLEVRVRVSQSGHATVLPAVVSPDPDEHEVIVRPADPVRAVRPTDRIAVPLQRSAEPVISVAVVGHPPAEPYDLGRPAAPQPVMAGHPAVSRADGSAAARPAEPTTTTGDARTAQHTSTTVVTARPAQARPVIGGPTPHASGPPRPRVAPDPPAEPPRAPDQPAPGELPPAHPAGLAPAGASAPGPLDRAPAARRVPRPVPQLAPTGHRPVPRAADGRPVHQGPPRYARPGGEPRFGGPPLEPPPLPRPPGRPAPERPRPYDHPSYGGGRFDRAQSGLPVPPRRNVPPIPPPAPPLRRRTAWHYLPGAAAVLALAATVVALAVLLVDVQNANPGRRPGDQFAAPAPAFVRTGPAAAASAPAAVVATSIAVPTVRSTMPVGATPGHLEVAPNGRFAVITHRAAGFVSVLDITINKITATIPIPAGPPRFVSFSPDSTRAYISVFNDAATVNAIAVLDTTTNTLLTTIPVGRWPFASAVTPDGTRLWVPSHDDARLDIIDTATNTLVTSVPVAPNPHWVTFTPDGTRAYIANHESDVVTVMDTASMTPLATIPVGTSPHSTAVAPNHGQAAVTNYEGNTVSIIDTTAGAVIADTPVGRGPQDVDYAPDGRYIYTADVDSDTVSVIDAVTRTVTATIPVCDAPTSVSTHPSGRVAYVTCLNSGEVMILDTTADQ